MARVPERLDYARPMPDARAALRREIAVVALVVLLACALGLIALLATFDLPAPP